jgi:hypothetical protein
MEDRDIVKIIGQVRAPRASSSGYFKCGPACGDYGQHVRIRL